jgi:hypothetical protein
MRRSIPPLAAGAAALGLALALILALALRPRDQGEEAPANAAALARIAEKNDDAALQAATRMREESARATAAVEANAGAQPAAAEQP